MAYSRDEGTRHFLRKLLALLHLPAEHSQTGFAQLETALSQWEECPTKAKIEDVLNYVNKTWIEANGFLWAPEQRSM